MKIGVIGAGMVGGGLGKRFAAAGHDIVYGVREPDQEKYAGLIEESGNGARAAVIVDARSRIGKRWSSPCRGRRSRNRSGSGRTGRGS